ncbi:MAG: hypothetical protein AAFQ01_01330, partial [Bacteroidota bacterium]
GGGMMCFREEFTDKGRQVIEEPMPSVFEDFILAQEDQHDYGLEQIADDLLKHGQYNVEYSRKGDGKPATLKPHPARCCRAEKQNKQGKIARWWLYGNWGIINEQQRLEEVRNLQSIPNYDPSRPQGKFMLRGADKLLGGPYYYHPHYHGSLDWMRVSNRIAPWHISNIDNGMAPRFIVKVPQDYYYLTLSADKQKDLAKLPQHLAEAKAAFKKRLNEFFSGVVNAGRSILLTKHIDKNLREEMPGVEITALEYDIKDDAMLKLYDSSNIASTSAHGTPPVLAGISTGAKMTSGSEVRNLYNFYQISAAPSPRRIISRIYRIAWNDFGLNEEFPELKLGFRNIEMQTTDKSPTGRATTPQEETPAE